MEMKEDNLLSMISISNFHHLHEGFTPREKKEEGILVS